MFPDKTITLLYSYIPNALFNMFNPNISRMDIQDFTQDVLMVCIDNESKIAGMEEQELKRWVSGVIVRKFTGIHRDDFKAKYQSGGTKFLQKQEKTPHSAFQKKNVKFLIHKIRSATPLSPPVIYAMRTELCEWEQNLYCLYIAEGCNLSALARYMNCSNGTVGKVIREIRKKINDKSTDYGFEILDN